MINLINALRQSIQNDLVDVYRSLTGGGSFKDLEFYRYVLSSNPKQYPISGLQHFIGAGFVAARLASFLGLDDYAVAVVFLAGLLHDMHKLSDSDSVCEKLKKTGLYISGIQGVLGDKRAEDALTDAVELSRKIWSGDIPRRLQCLADIVAVADVLTGGEESWSLSYSFNTIVKGALNRKPLCSSWIREENVLPVYIGKQRPLVTLVSEYIEEELEKLGAVPLISTSEGMLFLIKGSIDVSNIYEKMSEFVAADLGREVEEGQKKEAEIDVSRIKDFLDGRRSLATYSKTYTSIAGYSAKTIEKTFEKASQVLEDLRLFVVVLAYIYSKDPNKKEKAEVRIRRYLESIGLSSVTGKNSGEILQRLYQYLQNIEDHESLKKIAERAKEFVIGEMRKFRAVDTSLISEKLGMYISIGAIKQKVDLGSQLEKCAVCRDPVIVKRSLSSYLQELRKDAIKGLNISELFHPDIQGRPERVGSIEATGELPVCELCYFEAASYRQIGHTDGLWARVLVYYPAMSIDLMKAVKDGIYEATNHKVKVLNDYMTSRIIVPTGNSVLTRFDLVTSVDLWYVFGGNLIVTTTAISSAFTWRGLPIELEVTDAVVEEAVGSYMELTRNVRKYAWFTDKIRFWLYSLLRTYFEKLEDRTGKNISLLFSRSAASVTGFPSIDAFSLLMKQ